jgi:hypothetical protein
MSRERITNRAFKAADPSFGQSANDYWRKRAKDAVLGALSEVEEALKQEAQKVTDDEAQTVGVEPAQYCECAEEQAPAEEVPAEEEAVTAETEEVPEVAEDATEEPEETEKESKMAMVFEPRKKEAGAPVDPSAIGKENWFQVQEKFPQYTKQQKLTMLAVAPTKRNAEAVSAVTDVLDGIAGKLEESGDVEAAAQIDVISDLLTASVHECKKIASKSKK